MAGKATGRNEDLALALEAATILVGNNDSESSDATTHKNLDSVLQARLELCPIVFVSGGVNDPSKETAAAEQTDVRSSTGLAALRVVESLNVLLLGIPVREKRNSVLGSRDLSNIRTLLSLVFKWLTDPLLARISASWPTKSSLKHKSAVIDLTVEPDDIPRLASHCDRLLKLASPQSGTTITPIVIDKHLGDVLRPCVAVGWLPPSLLPSIESNYSAIRSATMSLLDSLQPSMGFSALGSVLQSLANVPHVKKAASFLLGRQLVRPDGVRGLCSATFGEAEYQEDIDELSALQKMEHFARILVTVPRLTKPEVFYKTVIPTSLLLLDTGLVQPLPPLHVRALAFALSRIITSSSHNGLLPKMYCLGILHRPLGYDVPPDFQIPETPNLHSAVKCLETISTLVAHADPSPSFMTTLLSPIIPSVYSLMSYLRQRRSSDPAFLDMCKSLFITWAKIITVGEVKLVLWQIIDGMGGEWKTDDRGDLVWSNRNSSVARQMPAVSTLVGSGEQEDQSPFSLRPSPSEFVDLLKSTGRSDVASGIFVDLLNSYLSLNNAGNDPLRLLLHLQLILSMEDQLSDSKGTASILSQPEQVLAFVQNALQLDAVVVPTESQALGLERLRFVEREHSEDGADSDDDEHDFETRAEKLPTDLITTALTLLLSILEAHPNLTASTTPLLDEIWEQLQSLANSESTETRTLAREARLVLASRLTFGSPPSSASGADEETARIMETYQKALKLLKDPIVPVRAHGIALLRDLVTASNTSSSKPRLDPALVPAIKAIFMESIQDDESFIFLNAVQGLAALVDVFGRGALQTLVGAYTDGLTTRPVKMLNSQMLDTRLRVGEALTQIIRRCGETLPLLVNDIVPPIARVISEPDVPTVLRMSAISVLAQCVDTNALSVSPYLVDLVNTMLDLLQLQTGASQGNDANCVPAPSDTGPTTLETKLAEFRRAALHFLRNLSSQASSESALVLPPDVIESLRIVVGYIAATDSDRVARLMATECLDNL